jgi:hypothetical protein
MERPDWTQQHQPPAPPQWRQPRQMNPWVPPAPGYSPPQGEAQTGQSDQSGPNEDQRWRRPSPPNYYPGYPPAYHGYPGYPPQAPTGR